MIAGDARYIRDAWPIVNVTWDEAQRVLPMARRPAADRSRVGTRGAWRRSPACGRGATPIARPTSTTAWRARPRCASSIATAYGVPLQFLGDADASDGTQLLAPPGSYAWGEGPYGTRDQAGNVAEWTADALGVTPGNLDLGAGYVGLSSINPHRDGRAGEPRVVRGGSWRQPAFLARANVRDPYNVLYVPDGRFTHIGFRCARSL